MCANIRITFCCWCIGYLNQFCELYMRNQHFFLLVLGQFLDNLPFNMGSLQLLLGERLRDWYIYFRTIFQYKTLPQKRIGGNAMEANHARTLLLVGLIY